MIKYFDIGHPEYLITCIGLGFLISIFKILQDERIHAHDDH